MPYPISQLFLSSWSALSCLSWFIVIYQFNLRASDSAAYQMTGCCINRRWLKSLRAVSAFIITLHHITVTTLPQEVYVLRAEMDSDNGNALRLLLASPIGSGRINSSTNTVLVHQSRHDMPVSCNQHCRVLAHDFGSEKPHSGTLKGVCYFDARA